MNRVGREGKTKNKTKKKTIKAPPRRGAGGWGPKNENDATIDEEKKRKRESKKVREREWWEE